MSADVDQECGMCETHDQCLVLLADIGDQTGLASEGTEVEVAEGTCAVDQGALLVRSRLGIDVIRDPEVGETGRTVRARLHRRGRTDDQSSHVPATEAQEHFLGEFEDAEFDEGTGNARVDVVVGLRAGSRLEKVRCQRPLLEIQGCEQR